MADITPYLRSAAIGTKVATRLGSASDGFKAGGYAAFVDGITGQPPRMVERADGTIALVQSAAQNAQIGQWAERQMLDSILKRKPAGKISYEIGPAFFPVAVKYAVPVAAGIFAAGLITARAIR